MVILMFFEPGNQEIDTGVVSLVEKEAFRFYFNVLGDNLVFRHVD